VKRWIPLVVQCGASALVLLLVLRQADFGGLAGTLTSAAPQWIVLAIACRVYVASSRVGRIAIGLTPWGRPQLPSLLGIGYLAALLNQVLPARTGDVLAVGLLKREQGFSIGAGASALVTTNLATSALTGVIFVGVLAPSLARWSVLVGNDTASSLSWVAVTMIAAPIGIAAFARLGGRFRPGDATASGMLRELARDAAKGLSRTGPVAWNVALGVPQLILSIVGTWALLPALGIQIELAVAGTVMFLLLTNLVAMALPELFGGSSAASGLVVLTLLGATEDQAVAFAATAWVVRVLPLVVLGAWPLWRRARHLGEGFTSARSLAPVAS